MTNGLGELGFTWFCMFFSTLQRAPFAKVVKASTDGGDRSPEWLR